MLEIWKYDPTKLSVSDTIDLLSLNLSLLSEEDERVQGELETLMEDTDGSSRMGALELLPNPSPAANHSVILLCHFGNMQESPRINRGIPQVLLML